MIKTIKGKLFYIYHHGTKRFYGNIGEFAFQVDGIKYYVGDTITSSFDNDEEFVINEDGEHPCVMGFVTSTSNERERLKIFREYNIQKCRSYTELQNGKMLSNIKAEIEDININKRII